MSTNSKKRLEGKRVLILFWGVGLLMAGLSVFAGTGVGIGVGTGMEIASSSVRGLGSSHGAPDQPVRLIIPAIKVSALIQKVGLSLKGDGTMGIPTNFVDVAWYKKGPLPGMPGSAVIAGHLDGKKVPKAVFYNLRLLKPGDLVQVVDKEGKILKFRVTKTKIYNNDGPTGSIFSGDLSKKRLNLITCAGDWIKSKKIYSQRIVVFTELSEY